jgi:sulfur carrier protein
MNVTVNNKNHVLKNASSINAMINQLAIETKGIAIAVNHTVISNSVWDNTILKENDNLTIIKATQGG